MIQVEALTFGYGDEALLEEASFEVRDGEVFAILGRSGSGKSALLRQLIGLEQPWSGTIHIDGVGAPRLEVDRAPAFGVMFEQGALLGSLTVGENLALPLQHWSDLSPRAVDVVVRAKLRMVGLEHVVEKYPSELSSGMDKRAGIARAQMLEPGLIFLDEPWSGLDPTTAVEIDELIRSLNRDLGTTIVLVSHTLPSIFAVVDRCVLLDDESPRLLASGDPRRLRDDAGDARVRGFFNRTLGAQEDP